jgi:hypothetical protein
VEISRSAQDIVEVLSWFCFWRGWTAKINSPSCKCNLASVVPPVVARTHRLDSGEVVRRRSASSSFTSPQGTKFLASGLLTGKRREQPISSEALCDHQEVSSTTRGISDLPERGAGNSF